MADPCGTVARLLLAPRLVEIALSVLPDTSAAVARSANHPGAASSSPSPPLPSPLSQDKHLDCMSDQRHARRQVSCRRSLPAVPTGELFTNRSIRPQRSRKDRPCDACRKAKHTCQILVRGEPCRRCARTGKTCAFDAPPLARHQSRPRDDTSSPGPGNSTPGRAYAQSWRIDLDAHEGGPSRLAPRRSPSLPRDDKQAQVFGMMLSGLEVNDSDEEANVSVNDRHGTHGVRERLMSRPS